MKYALCPVVRRCLRVPRVAGGELHHRGGDPSQRWRPPGGCAPMMTPEIEAGLAAIERTHGPGSLERVRRMLDPRQRARHPMQKQAKWILPGIAQQPWHDPHAYPTIAPIVERLEASHAAIKRELVQAWSGSRERFGNYEHYMVTRDDWKALYVFRKGRLVADTAALVPETYRIVDELAVRTGLLCPLLESHFSTLLPGAVIPPHCDLWNFSINLHFAIDIPKECAIRVAGEERTWTEGNCLLFDYSFLHDAYNRSDRPRTCLLLDLWHPDVTLPERDALTFVITEIRTLMGEN